MDWTSVFKTTPRLSASKCLQLHCVFALAAFLLVPTSQAGDAMSVPSPLPLTDHDKPLSQYALRSWDTRDGLPHNSVNNIAQDRDGYLWLATWEGPVRFNGREFSVFDDLNVLQMPESGVLGVVADPASRSVWFSGPRGGMTHFDGSQWQGMDNAPGFVFQLARDHQNNIWAAASSGGVARYTGQQRTRVYTTDDGLPEGFVYRLYMAPAQGERPERLWVGTSGGLAFYDAASDSFVHDTSFPNEQVRGLLLHSSGMMLVSSENGLYFQNNPGEPFTPWPDIGGGALRGPVTALAEGPYGGIWFGTFTRGLGRITADGLSWIDTNSGLPNPQVLSIFKDRENNMWVSTHSGLVQLRDALFTSYTETHGVQGNFVRAIAVDTQQRIWLGSNQGLSVKENSAFSPAVADPEFNPISILALAAATDGGMYVGGYNKGLFKVVDGEVVAQLGRDHGLTRNEVRGIYVLTPQRLILGIPSGFAVVDDTPDGFELVGEYNDPAGHLPATVTDVVLVSDTEAFFTSTMGITQVSMVGEPDAWLFEHIDLAAFTPARNAFSATLHEQQVWFATDRGLVMYDLNDQRWHWIGREQGLPFDKYFNIVFDEQDNLWLGSNRGVTVVGGDSMAVLLAGVQSQVQTFHFREAEGLVSSQVNTGGPSSLRDSYGRLWFATALGASKVDGFEFSQSDVVPPTSVIERALADGKPLHTGVSLPADTQRLEFYFAGLGYRMTDHIQYQVKLRGFDSDWVSQDQQVSTQYTALPPGEFEFLVRSRYPGGVWSEPANLQFQRQPQVWQTLWFWVLVVSAVVGLVYAVFYWRTYQLEQTERELKRLVAEKTRALELLANEDPLTKLANRRAFDQRVQQEVARAKREMTPLCIAIIDLDHFKAINDNFTHSIGDSVLVQVGEVLTANLRNVDFIARWGGEEFAVLFPNATPQEAKVVCERLRKALAATRFKQLPEGWKVTMSIGLTELVQGYNYDKALVDADNALYRAKESGRNQLQIAKQLT